MSFGNKVLQLRKEKNWSQTELGKEIKTSAAMVGKYERNEINPSIEVAKKLSETFSVTIDYLINDSGENDIFKDIAMVERFQKIDNLSEEDKSHAIFLIDAIIRDSSTRRAYSK